MVIDKAIPMEQARKKLKKLERYMPEQHHLVYDFAAYLADKIKTELAPLGFVLTANIALNDLQKVDKDTISARKSIDSHLTDYNSTAYNELSLMIPEIAKAVLPDEFADEVKQIYCRFGNSEASKRKAIATPIGEAYAFFYYQGKSQDILDALPAIKEKTDTHPKLELILTEGPGKLDTAKDPTLTEIVKKAERQHMSHVLKATLPNTGNNKTADYLAPVMNGLYTCLYKEKEPFYAGIVYKKGKKYVFKRE